MKDFCSTPAAGKTSLRKIDLSYGADKAKAGTVRFYNNFKPKK